MNSHRLRDCEKLWSDTKSQPEIEKFLAYELTDMGSGFMGVQKKKSDTLLSVLTRQAEGMKLGQLKDESKEQFH